MNEEEVRMLIRDRIRTGQLPTGSDGRTYGARRTNNACLYCGQKIGWHEIEYEVHVNWSDRAFRAHIDCYGIYRQERIASEAPEKMTRRVVSLVRRRSA